MDEQGVEAAWMFPSQGVCMEGPMQPDIEASIHILGAFNRWIEDDWGFAYQDRIFGVPFLTLSDVDGAVAELEWCIERGARVVSIRNGPAFTPEGTKSPADPMFDPFWARAAEARVVVAPHAGFEDGYTLVNRAVAEEWGRTEAPATGMGDAAMSSVDRHADEAPPRPRLRGRPRRRQAVRAQPGRARRVHRERRTWVPDMLHGLQVLHGQNPGMFATNPVDQFLEHCWVAPFVEDSVPDLATVLPVERILFGSDWPHAEGIAHPRDFFEKVDSFSIEDQRKIMVENARELTLHLAPVGASAATIHASQVDRTCCMSWKSDSVNSRAATPRIIPKNAMADALASTSGRIDPSSLPCSMRSANPS